MGEILAFDEREKVDEQETRQGPLGHSNPLQSERGNTSIADGVVQKIAGIAALEVKGVQMGSGTARAAGDFFEGVTSGGGVTRGVSVEVGEVETAIDLTMAVEYGRPIPQLLNEVRRNVINRVGGLVGLDVMAVNVTVNAILLPEERRQQEQEQQVRSKSCRHRGYPASLGITDHQSTARKAGSYD